jgi:hypothetical protein
MEQSPSPVTELIRQSELPKALFWVNRDLLGWRLPQGRI